MRIYFVWLLVFLAPSLSLASYELNNSLVYLETLEQQSLVGEFLASGFIITSPYQDLFPWQAFYQSDIDEISLVVKFPLDPGQVEELNLFCLANSLDWRYCTRSISGEHCTVFSFTNNEDSLKTLIDQLGHMTELSFIYELDINY